MDIREESIEPELVLSPAELNPLNQRRKERQALCFYFLVFPVIFTCLFVLSFSRASDRNLHSKPRSGPRMPIGSRPHVQINVLNSQVPSAQSHNWGNWTHPQRELVVPIHQISPETPFLKVLPEAGPHSKSPGRFCLFGLLSPFKKKKVLKIIVYNCIGIKRNTLIFYIKTVSWT